MSRNTIASLFDFEMQFIMPEIGMKIFVEFFGRRLVLNNLSLQVGYAALKSYDVDILGIQRGSRLSNVFRKPLKLRYAAENQSVLKFLAGQCDAFYEFVGRLVVFLNDSIESVNRLRVNFRRLCIEKRGLKGYILLLDQGV